MLVHPRNPAILMQKLLLENEMHITDFLSNSNNIQNLSSTSLLQGFIFTGIFNLIFITHCIIFW